MDREAWWTVVQGFAKSWTRLSTPAIILCISLCIRNLTYFQTVLVFISKIVTVLPSSLTIIFTEMLNSQPQHFFP